MLALYIGTMLFGFVLIAISALLGGGDQDGDMDVDHDADVDSELDADADADHDVDNDAADLRLWLPFLSMRFYTFLSFAFGLSGTLMTLLGLPLLAVLFAAIVIGFGFGWIAAWLFRRLSRDIVTADVGLDRYVGQEARVLLAVRQEKRGKIVIHTPTGRIELPADTGDDEPFERGDIVLIAHIDHGIANITSLPRLGRTAAKTSDPHEAASSQRQKETS